MHEHAWVRGVDFADIPSYSAAMVNGEGTGVHIMASIKICLTFPSSLRP